MRYAYQLEDPGDRREDEELKQELKIDRMLI